MLRFSQALCDFPQKKMRLSPQTVAARPQRALGNNHPDCIMQAAQDHLAKEEENTHEKPFPTDTPDNPDQ
jgi:hypothetical protein